MQLGSYSTTEQATRYKWIDGKVIYKKTVSIGTLPNATQKDVPHGISSLGSIVYLEGVAMRSSDSTFLFLPNTSMDALVNMIELYSQGSNITIKAGTNRSTYIGYVTLYYTKST